MPGVRLKVSDLAVRFGTDPILQVQQLDIVPEGLVVFTGPSGSGKTTLLHVLAGILKPTTGVVQWGDQVISGRSQSASDRWRRKNCGMVFQDFHLIEQLTPVQNVLLPATFANFIIPQSYRERASGLLKQFGVPTDVRSVTTLSRGERQRVAIARALIGEPQILLADEPTASLDGVAAEQIADSLVQVAGTGRTVIAASHDTAVIARATRIVRLEHGRIVSDAPVTGRVEAAAV